MRLAINVVGVAMATLGLLQLLDGYYWSGGILLAGAMVALVIRHPRPLGWISNAMATTRCNLLHRQHWRAHMVGLFDCQVECRKCGRQWWVN